MDYAAFLNMISSQWCEKLNLAAEHKDGEFMADARDCMRFYHQPHDFLYDPAWWKQRARHEFNGAMRDDTIAMPTPTMKITVNKTAEFVQVFGPFLYYQNPVRMVRPRKIPFPPKELLGMGNPPPAPEGAQMTPEQMMYMQQMMQYQQLAQMDAMESLNREYRATLLESLLNYTPNELDLKTESRNAIDEALIKGRGVMWHSIWKSQEGTMRLPGSFFDSVDRLLIDPDATNLRDAKWVALQCTESWWEVERRYNLPYGSLREYAQKESMAIQSSMRSDQYAYDRRKKAETCDQLVYYRIWSRMGVGGRLNTWKKEDAEALETFGSMDGRPNDNVFLIVADGIPFPLNLPPMTSAANPQEISARLAWPIPYHKDDIHPWPFSELDFHWKPNSVWPIAHLTFVMGFQMFLSWAYSFMGSKITRTCRNITLYDKSFGDEFLEALENGNDDVLIGCIKKTQNFEEVMQVLKQPEMNTDLWRVLEAISNAFEQGSGMTPLMQGMSAHAYRSAEEANLKGDFAKVRPDDMANKVGHWQTLVCRKEALAAQWVIGAQDVAPIMGNVNAKLWEQYVHPVNPEAVARELDYRIEAGSAKRPNVEADLANSAEAVQFMGPIGMQAWQATGDPTLLNSITSYWGKPRNLPAETLRVPPLLPPEPPAAQGTEAHQQAKAKKEQESADAQKAEKKEKK